MSFLWKILGLSKEDRVERERKTNTDGPHATPFSDAVRQNPNFSINPIKIPEKPEFRTQIGAPLARFKEVGMETDISVPTDFRPNWEEEYHAIAVQIQRSFDRPIYIEQNISPNSENNSITKSVDIEKPASSPNIIESQIQKDNKVELRDKVVPTNDKNENSSDSEKNKSSTENSESESQSDASQNNSSSDSGSQSSQESQSESEHEKEPEPEPPVRRKGFANLPAAPKPSTDDNVSSFNFSFSSAKIPDIPAKAKQQSKPQSDSDSSDDSDSDDSSNSSSDSDSEPPKKVDPPQELDTIAKLRQMYKERQLQRSSSGFYTDFSKKPPPKTGFNYSGYSGQNNNREQSNSSRGRGRGRGGSRGGRGGNNNRVRTRNDPSSDSD